MKTGLALLLIGAMDTRMQAKALDLEASLARAIANKVYQTPARADLSRARELFKHTLQTRWTMTELKRRWVDLGFGLQELRAEGGTLWLVSELPGKESGRGWYLFRKDGRGGLALEAPHARNDIHTGRIGLRLFQTGQARVFAASTITRHRADMARLDNTFFQAFTLAFAEACPTGLVVQLHGFDAGSPNRAKADIVASAGTRSPELWLDDLVSHLKRAASLLVLAFPQDTKQLGATLNAQGRALRNSRHCRFLHLEMTAELRERLTRDDELCRVIQGCLSSPPAP